MTGLLEAAAAVGISASVLLLMTTSLSSAVRIQALSSEVTGELFAERQLEQLVDRAASLAGNGPARPSAIVSLSDDTVVFASDGNGDGIVDPTSSETTALETRRANGNTVVRLRLGRQTMQVLDAGDDDVTIVAFDADGGIATAATATLFALERSRGDPFAPDPPARLLFSLPARTMP
jgi:hypothetical protein